MGVLQIIEHVCTVYFPFLGHYLLFVTHCSRLHMQRIVRTTLSPASISCSKPPNDALLDASPDLNITTGERNLMSM